MRAVVLGQFRCVFAAVDGDAALRAALVGLVGIWLWDGLTAPLFERCRSCSVVAFRIDAAAFFGVLGRRRREYPPKKGFF